MVAGTLIERAGSNMDLESGMTVTIGAAGVKLDMRGTHANIARHVRRTASALDRDSPVHPPVSQKGAYRDLDDAKEKDWNRGHKLDPPEGDYTAGQKDKKRGATASTKSPLHHGCDRRRRKLGRGVSNCQLVSIAARPYKAP